jgi:hypothetical protein
VLFGSGGAPVIDLGDGKMPHAASSEMKYCPWKKADSMSYRIKKLHLNISSIVTLIITVSLFVIALFEKGLTHDILLEAGVFLVSVKVVIGTHKLSNETQEIDEKLDQILSYLGGKETTSKP